MGLGMAKPRLYLKETDIGDLSPSLHWLIMDEDAVSSWYARG
jgi:hypothetical protein